MRLVGQKRLVLDLSCRRRGTEYYVVTDRWQRFSELVVNEATLATLSASCDEFLVRSYDFVFYPYSSARYSNIFIRSGNGDFILV